MSWDEIGRRWTENWGLLQPLCLSVASFFPSIRESHKQALNKGSGGEGECHCKAEQRLAAPHDSHWATSIALWYWSLLAIISLLHYLCWAVLSKFSLIALAAFKTKNTKKIIFFFAFPESCCRLSVTVSSPTVGELTRQQHIVLPNVPISVERCYFKIVEVSMWHQPPMCWHLIDLFNLSKINFL